MREITFYFSFTVGEVHWESGKVLGKSMYSLFIKVTAEWCHLQQAGTSQALPFKRELNLVSYGKSNGESTVITANAGQVHLYPCIRLAPYKM